MGEVKENTEKVFYDNINIAYDVANKYIKKHNLYAVKEDIIQLSLQGLWEACLRFDKDKGCKLSTIATPYCLGRIQTGDTYLSTRNERERERRHGKRFIVISAHQELAEKGNTDKLEMLDAFVDESVLNDEDDIIFKNDFKRFLKELTPLEKQLMYYKKKKFTQMEVAKRLGYSQVTINKYYRLIKEKWFKWSNEMGGEIWLRGKEL